MFQVFFNCWNSSEEITTYMKEQGYETNVEGFIKLWGEFHEKALKIWDEELEAVGQTPQPVMIWSSELTQPHRVQKYLNKDRCALCIYYQLFSSFRSSSLRLYAGSFVGFKAHAMERLSPLTNYILNNRHQRKVRGSCLSSII